MPQNLADNKSTLVQVMAWCRQATSHYLNQCWPRSAMPYGVTWPQWVNAASDPYFYDTKYLSLTCFWVTSGAQNVDSTTFAWDTRSSLDNWESILLAASSSLKPLRSTIRLMAWMKKYTLMAECVINGDATVLHHAIEMTDQYCYPCKKRFIITTFVNVLFDCTYSKENETVVARIM